MGAVKLSQTIVASGYYGIETLLQYQRNLVTQPFLVAGVSEPRIYHNTVL